MSHYSILLISNRISADVFVCNRKYIGFYTASFVINIIIFYRVIVARVNEIYGIDDSVPICTIGNIYYSWFCYSKPSN